MQCTHFYYTVQLHSITIYSVRVRVRQCTQCKCYYKAYIHSVTIHVHDIRIQYADTVPLHVTCVIIQSVPGIPIKCAHVHCSITIQCTQCAVSLYSVHNVPLSGIHIVVFQCKQHYYTLLHNFTMQYYHIYKVHSVHIVTIWCTWHYYMVNTVLLIIMVNTVYYIYIYIYIYIYTYGKHSVTQCHYSDMVYTV